MGCAPEEGQCHGYRGGGEAVKMGAVEFYTICTKVDEAKLRFIMIKTGGISDHYCIKT